MMGVNFLYHGVKSKDCKDTKQYAEKSRIVVSAVQY